jgi:uncharacterized protein YuzE
MEPDSYYTPDGDIAYLRVRDPSGAVSSREETWGLLDYDAQGQLVGVEIWGASERLPAEVLDVLPRLEGRGAGAEPQPA